MTDHNTASHSLVNTYLTEVCGIDPSITELVNDCERELAPLFAELDQRTEYHQLRVLHAFQENRISDVHFGWNTGYGYDDAGRDAVERVFANVFQTEKALVRTNIVNGTHAIALGLLGVLRPGDELLYCTGMPYDTLQSVIGCDPARYQPGDGTLRDLGVSFAYVPLAGNQIDLEALAARIRPETKIVAIQRSMGYGWRNNISVNQIEAVCSLVHALGRDDLYVLVDNCYSEFIDEGEPAAAGADLVCGSLIKNPGGGLALSGGYVCGKAALIDRIAFRLTCPGIGAECGLTYGQTRAMLQGLFFAPKVTNGAVKGAMLLGEAARRLGYAICPDTKAKRGDIIQAVRFGDPRALEAFCRGIQEAAPIDSFVTPVAAPMPGYDDDVIMAAGAFVQGASIELSADAPMREPYIAYFQGGLTYEHSKYGVMKALDVLKKEGLLRSVE